MTYHNYYRLNPDRTTSPCDMETWAQSHRPTKVAHSLLMEEEIQISTVFLGLNHAFDEGPPLLFETMVFADEYPAINQEMDRYTTWEEALVGHAVMLDRVEAYLILHRAGIIP